MAGWPCLPWQYPPQMRQLAFAGFCRSAGSNKKDTSISQGALFCQVHELGFDGPKSSQISYLLPQGVCLGVSHLGAVVSMKLRTQFGGVTAQSHQTVMNNPDQKRRIGTLIAVGLVHHTCKEVYHGGDHDSKGASQVPQNERGNDLSVCSRRQVSRDKDQGTVAI
jgi:hypothetical protein